MDKIEDILTRGVENIIPNKELLEKLLRSGKKLNIYNGIDPTATKIHLGHGFPLRKLQAFVDLGHNVTFLIGDFTALIGDTSDKEGERPVLTSQQIEDNFKTYKNQAEKFLDFSKVTIVHNSDWLRKLTFREIVELCQHYSLGDFISRELIRKRMDAGTKVRLDEVLYPVMQGYDSYYMDTDVQVGGTDQTFNMQAGRTLQKDIRNKESFVLSTGFLEGTDGRKMSKSWGNAIWVEDPPEEMFGKVMSLKDNLIIQYFTLATNVPLENVTEAEKRLKSGKNPMTLKKELAFQIVSELHSKEAAQKAREEFEKTFQKGEVAHDLIEEIKVDAGLPLADKLVQGRVVASKSEAKRLIDQNAVEEIKPNLFRIGKKKFVKFI